jgi:cytochrome c biogenesis protein CcmG/thiol:disulfide interchange protein DsbE
VLRSILSRLRLDLRLLAVVGLVLVSALAFAPRALGDGDPGSDVLVNQSSFVPADAGISIPQQLQLTTMLRVAASGGAPVRVAIISHRDDLGAITALWGKPQAYANFLGTELSLAYTGRLLIVMPDGFGFFWKGHPTAASEQALAGLTIGTGGLGLITAAESGAARLASTAGVTLSTPPTAAGSRTAPASSPSTTVPTIVGGGSVPARAARPGGSTATVEIVVIAAAVLLAALAVALALWRRSRRDGGERRARRLPRLGPPTGRVAFFAMGGSVAVVAVLVLIVIVSAGPSGSTASALATNPDLDYGTTLGAGPAPNFTLYDQTGHTVSLSSFRGKVTLVSFTDSECTTICPLTNQAMLDAKAMLGPAGTDVQLVGIDANPKATQVEDVLSYTQLHGLVGKWDFLTGSIAQLKKVWHAYGVEAAITGGLISHTPALYVIDQQGRLRKLYMTQQSYASVTQFGQVLAHEVSALLPSHPAVHSHLSYTTAASTSPKATARLPRSGGGQVTIGPGHAHLYLFFDTWDREVSSLGGELDAFNRYAATASRSGLPGLTAIDEGSVEPSRRALPAFLHTLPQSLRYPVGVDRTGSVADGYEVQGVPWMVLTSATGKILWYDEVVDAKWPTVRHVESEVRAALTRTHRAAAGSEQSDLIGSPAPLAALHRQASTLLGSDPALMARIKALHGYPIVVNIWASWCQPCQREFPLFATASEQYGREVAFLGADTNDPNTSDAESFLRSHHVSYPSYTDASDQLSPLLPGGLQGTPTTVFINRAGKVVDVHTGEYESAGSLDADIKTYAVGAG